MGAQFVFVEVNWPTKFRGLAFWLARSRMVWRMTKWSRTFLDPLTVTQLFKFHRHIYKSPAPDLNVNQINPVQDPSPCFFNIHFGCILPTANMFIKLSLLQISELKFRIKVKEKIINQS